MGAALYLLGGVIGFGLAVSLAPKATIVEVPYPVAVGQKGPGPALPAPCPPVPACPPPAVPAPPEPWPLRPPEFEAP